MLDKSTEKTGRMVTGTLCAKMPKGVNVFDDSAIEVFKTQAIIKAVDDLIDEFIDTYGIKPTSMQITNTDKKFLVVAMNVKKAALYEELQLLYIQGVSLECPIRPRDINSWDDNVEYEGIKLKTGCSIKDGVVLLQSFE